QDAVSGLDYYVARYYDPLLGQFTSGDTVMEGLNRFAYVGGNPETRTDPSGHKVCDDDCHGGDGKSGGGGGGSRGNNGGGGSGGCHTENCGGRRVWRGCMCRTKRRSSGERGIERLTGKYVSRGALRYRPGCRC